MKQIDVEISLPRGVTVFVVSMGDLLVCIGF